MSTTEAQDQTSIYETVVDDAEIEQALETREKAKASKAAVAKKFKDADDVAKGLLERLDLGVGAPVRVGRFVVALKERPGRSVSFDTPPSTQLSISTIDEG